MAGKTSYRYAYSILYNYNDTSEFERGECQGFVAELKTKFKERTGGKYKCFSQWDEQVGKDPISVLQTVREQSKVTIILFSPGFVENKWHNYSHKHVFHFNLDTERLFPILIMGTKKPEHLSNVNALEFSPDWRNDSRKWDILLGAICNHLDQVNELDNIAEEHDAISYTLPSSGKSVRTKYNYSSDDDDLNEPEDFLEKNLLNISNEIGMEFKPIALQLGIKAPELEQLQHDNTHSTHNLILTILIKWKQRTTIPSEEERVKQLQEVLKTCGRKDLCDKIGKEYKKYNATCVEKQPMEENVQQRSTTVTKNSKTISQENEDHQLAAVLDRSSRLQEGHPRRTSSPTQHHQPESQEQRNGRAVLETNSNQTTSQRAISLNRSVDHTARQQTHDQVDAGFDIGPDHMQAASDTQDFGLDNLKQEDEHLTDGSCGDNRGMGFSKESSSSEVSLNKPIQQEESISIAASTAKHNNDQIRGTADGDQLVSTLICKAIQQEPPIAANATLGNQDNFSAGIRNNTTSETPQITINDNCLLARPDPDGSSDNNGDDEITKVKTLMRSGENEANQMVEQHDGTSSEVSFNVSVQGETEQLSLGNAANNNKPQEKVSKNKPSDTDLNQVTTHASGTSPTNQYKNSTSDTGASNQSSPQGAKQGNQESWTKTLTSYFFCNDP